MTTATGETPSVLCFDATGTLIELRESVGEIYHRVALEFGVSLPAWRLDDAFKRVLRHAPPLGTEGENEAARRAAEPEWWAERIRQTFQATDSSVQFPDFPAFAATLFETFEDDALWRVCPGIPELLTQLADRGHPLCVISNFDHRLPKILQATDLAQFFKAILLPAKVGATKPERPLFEVAAASFGVPLSALTYLGDDPPESMDAIRAHGVCALDIRALLALPEVPNPIEEAASL
ncbi:MAG: HAD family hydrolase [Myxococcota bacterium]